MSQTNFENYLESQLKDPAVKAEFDAFGAHIRNVENLLAIFALRSEELGLNRTDIAGRMKMQPSNVRRWFSAPNQNPSFAAMLELASCLDLEIRAIPKKSKGR